MQGNADYGTKTKRCTGCLAFTNRLAKPVFASIKSEETSYFATKMENSNGLDTFHPR